MSSNGCAQCSCSIRTTFVCMYVVCVLGGFRNVKSLINWKWKKKKNERNWYKGNCKTYRNMCTQTNISIKSQNIFGTKSQHLLLILLRIVFEIEFVRMSDSAAIPERTGQIILYPIYWDQNICAFSIYFYALVVMLVVIYFWSYNLYF